MQLLTYSMTDPQQSSKSALQSIGRALTSDEVGMRSSKQRTISSTIVIKLGNLVILSDLYLF